MSIMYQIPNMPRAEQFINDAILDMNSELIRLLLAHTKMETKKEICCAI